MKPVSKDTYTINKQKNNTHAKVARKHLKTFLSLKWLLNGVSQMINVNGWL